MLKVTRNQPMLAPMREMFDSLADGLAGSTMPGTLPVDIVEYQDRYQIIASVPGFTRDQITIEVDKGVLSINAVRTDPAPTGGDGGDCCGSDCCTVESTTLRNERYTGSTGRRIRMPSEVDDKTVSAALENGVLTLTVAKPVEHEPRRVTIA